jgi:hypothetical protein
LQDWPSHKHEFQELIQEALRKRAAANAPVAGLALHFTISEGKTVVLVGPDGSRTEMRPQRHEAKVELSREEVLKNAGGSVPDALRRLAESLGREIDLGMIQQLREAPPQTGTLIRGGTTNVVKQRILKGLRSMEMEFDDGEPRLAFVAHPDAAAQLAVLNADPDLRARFDAILEEKRHEWVRRESRRRLAD